MARDDDAFEEDEGVEPAPRGTSGTPRRPAQRRRDDDDDEQGDVTGGLIPYKNPKALTAYYCGIFSLIPCLGLILGPLAVILGVLGLRYRSMHPTAAGGPHALVGIILGSIVLIGHLMVLTFAGLAALKAG